MVTAKVNTLQEGTDVSIKIEGNFETIINELAVVNSKILIGLSDQTGIPVTEVSDFLEEATLGNILDTFTTALDELRK